MMMSSVISSYEPSVCIAFNSAIVVLTGRLGSNPPVGGVSNSRSTHAPKLIMRMDAKVKTEMKENLLMDFIIFGKAVDIILKYLLSYLFEPHTGLYEVIKSLHIRIARRKAVRIFCFKIKAILLIPTINVIGVIQQIIYTDINCKYASFFQPVCCP